MKKILYTFILVGALLLAPGCKDYLDINRNPNGPEKVTAYLYLGSMEQQLALAMQYDARMIGYYVQNFANYSASTTGYDAMGTPAWTSDVDEHWRAVYWKMGINLSDMISKSEAEQRWDLAGIGYALRAWGWQMLTDMHGPIILKQAFQPGLYSFDYDNEDVVYAEVVTLCKKAIELLNRADGSTSAAFAGKGDQIFAGDRVKWKKFTYGILALNMSHLSNKSALYDPAKLISYVDSSLTSNTDNALIGFTGSISDDASFFGPMRANFLAARPSKFTVSLLDGTALGTADPRIRIMLPPSTNIKNAVPGALYVGVTPTLGYSAIPANDQPFNLYGLLGVGTPASGTIGMYLFTNNIKWPMMTYSELQFIKAEAAMRQANKVLALDAFSKGVDKAIDFTNGYAGVTSFGTTVALTAGEKTTLMTGLGALPTSDPNLLTVSKIMAQKYVHLWGWGFMETWTDMRRYHYTDKYGSETNQVFTGFTLPTLAAENNGKLIYRVRPRYNSEYVWNSAALSKIGGLEKDYHTYPIWITIVE